MGRRGGGSCGHPLKSPPHPLLKAALPAALQVGGQYPPILSVWRPADLQRPCPHAASQWITRVIQCHSDQGVLSVCFYLEKLPQRDVSTLYAQTYGPTNVRLHTGVDRFLGLFLLRLTITGVGWVETVPVPCISLDRGYSSRKWCDIVLCCADYSAMFLENPSTSTPHSQNTTPSSTPPH